MNIFEQRMAEVGYTPITTFWDDFSIAERYGESAIKDTYKRAFNEWKTNVKYITELVMVLNHKIWYYYYENNMKLSKLYDTLWRKADGWCVDNLKGEDLNYFYRTTD